MAPTRSKTKQRKSTESTASSVKMPNSPGGPQMVSIKTRSPVRTPIHKSPAKRIRAGITMGQKQALIDNLQLEITERARKLRAQYMLQAQGLRTRVEIRVNRIPMALRKAKMGNLLRKYSETGAKNVHRSPQRLEKVASPAKNHTDDIREQLRASPPPQKPKKRTSDEITPADKENEDVENPKKRLRGAPGQANSIVSQGKLAPSQVLSPRSANSRSFVRSPIRPPAKSALARPVSPLKPIAPTPAGGAAGILTNMVEKAKATRGAAGRKAAAAKPTTANTRAGRGRGAAAPAPAPARAARGRASAVSDSSDSSNTTVVRKAVPPKKEPVKRTVMGTLRGMGAGASKKAPPAAKAAALATAGRVLRKRN